MRSKHIPPSMNQVSAVLFAGGRGRRLRPLTDTCPKPMLPVNGVPLLEITLGQLARTGVKRVWIAINYLGHVIEEHFGDGSQFGLQIRYVRETQKLGTAGALSLVPPMPGPIIAMNADILCDVDFAGLVAQHVKAEDAATMCVRENRVPVAYGVVDTVGDRLLRHREKPELTTMINTGIYCLAPEILSRIPSNHSYDMPELFERLLREESACGVHRIEGRWCDIGSFDDYKQADQVFADLAQPYRASSHTSIETESGSNVRRFEAGL